MVDQWCLGGRIRPSGNRKINVWRETSSGRKQRRENTTGGGGGVRALEGNDKNAEQLLALPVVQVRTRDLIYKTVRTIHNKSVHVHKSQK